MMNDAKTLLIVAVIVALEIFLAIKLSNFFDYLKRKKEGRKKGDRND